MSLRCQDTASCPLRRIDRTTSDTCVYTCAECIGLLGLISKAVLCHKRNSLHAEGGADAAREPVGGALRLNAPQEQQQQLEGGAEPVGGRPEGRARGVAEP